MKAYAGIGSREISLEEKHKIFRIAEMLKDSYVVYSGNAPGSDITFQMGSDSNYVAFLPWHNFNFESFNCSDGRSVVISRNDIDAYQSVKQFHPSPNNLSDPAIKLMARNFRQVHGIPDMNLPKIDFVVCCANGTHKSVNGGTGQAVRIANSLEIPVVNIRYRNWQSMLSELTQINFEKL